MDTALTISEASPEQRSTMLQKARAEFGSKKPPFIPEIKLVNVKSPYKDEYEKGEFIAITEEKDGEETKKVSRSIGTNPEVVILKRCYSYSAYDSDNEQIAAWTNEFDGFSPMHKLVLVAKQGNEIKPLFTGPFPDFKERKEELQSQVGHKLKFKNILYVVFEDQIYRLIVSNASVTGVVDGEKHGDYSNPQPGSLEDVVKKIEGAGWDLWFLAKVKLGSLLLEKNEYYVITFEYDGQVEDRQKMENAYCSVEDGLKQLFAIRFGEFLTPIEPVVNYEQNIKVEDLPF